MDIFISNLSEVKKIIEVVNLKTFIQTNYLKCNQGTYKYPLSVVQNAYKNIEAVLDRFIWDAADPNHAVVFDENPDLAIYFERDPIPGEIDEYQFDLSLIHI